MKVFSKLSSFGIATLIGAMSTTAVTAGASVPVLAQADDTFPLDGRTAYRLASDVAVASITWQGGFFEETEARIERFVLRLYSDEQGRPGAVVLETELDDFERREAGPGIFTYEAPLQLSKVRGGKWMEIQAQAPAAPQWGIVSIEAPTVTGPAMVRCAELGISDWIRVPMGPAPARITSMSSPAKTLEVATPGLSVFPNPMTDAVRVGFALPTKDKVRVEIFNAEGRRIRDLGEQEYSAGDNSIEWDGQLDGGATAPSGLYLVRVSGNQLPSLQGKFLRISKNN